MAMSFKYLSVSEAAERLGVTRQAVQYFIQTGRLEATWILGRWGIPAEAITRLKRQRTARQKAAA
jgi:excisionase family DNA binding protein